MKELDEIKVRSEAATPGPWEHNQYGTGIRYGGEYNFITLAGGRGIVAERMQSGTAADAEFIAHARTDVPRLIGALEAAEASLVKLVEHFREGLVPEDRESKQHVANSNRAFGADCALDAFRDTVDRHLGRNGR